MLTQQPITTNPHTGRMQDHEHSTHYQPRTVFNTRVMSGPWDNHNEDYYSITWINKEQLTVITVPEWHSLSLRHCLRLAQMCPGWCHGTLRHMALTVPIINRNRWVSCGPAAVIVRGSPAQHVTPWLTTEFPWTIQKHQKHCPYLSVRFHQERSVGREGACNG